MDNHTWYVYLLECKRGLYCGVTIDPARREQEHNDTKKQARAVKLLGTPARMVYTEKCASKREAYQREYAIKQLTRTQKMELINEQR